MSAERIDVLAVMDARGRQGCTCTNCGHAKRAAEMREARVAVAELISAADEASVALGKSMQHTDELCSHMRLCAALSRVQGGES